MFDIGESLVGSYFRYVRKCDFVAYNTQIPGIQGEIDVIGIKLRPREVWFCEVITHIRGTLYGDYAQTARKIKEKVVRTHGFAVSRFPHHRMHFEVWSPVTPEGKLTGRLQRVRSDLKRRRGIQLDYVLNDAYATRVQELVDHSATDSTATSETAYRLLQILTRVKGRLKF